jgi:hypothetical protein
VLIIKLRLWMFRCMRMKLRSRLIPKYATMNTGDMRISEIGFMIAFFRLNRISSCEIEIE